MRRAPEFLCSRSDSRCLKVHVATAGGWLTRYRPREVRNSIYRYRKIHIDYRSKFLYRFISSISIIYGNTNSNPGYNVGAFPLIIWQTPPVDTGNLIIWLAFDDSGNLDCYAPLLPIFLSSRWLGESFWLPVWPTCLGFVTLLLDDAEASLEANGSTAFKRKLCCHWLQGL